MEHTDTGTPSSTPSFALQSSEVGSARIGTEDGLREVFRWAIRADFVSYVGAGPFRNGRLANAKILAMLALNMCADGDAYPFDLRQLQMVDHPEDRRVACRFIEDQLGTNKSKWTFEDVEPNGLLDRLKRMAEMN